MWPHILLTTSLICKVRWLSLQEDFVILNWVLSSLPSFLPAFLLSFLPSASKILNCLFPPFWHKTLSSSSFPAKAGSEAGCSLLGSSLSYSFSRRQTSQESHWKLRFQKSFRAFVVIAPSDKSPDIFFLIDFLCKWYLLSSHLLALAT